MPELRDVLTILPTVVRADERMSGVVQVCIRDPGVRVIAVSGGTPIDWVDGARASTATAWERASGHPAARLGGAARD